MKILPNLLEERVLTTPMEELTHHFGAGHPVLGESIQSECFSDIFLLVVRQLPVAEMHGRGIINENHNTLLDLTIAVGDNHRLHQDEQHDRHRSHATSNKNLRDSGRNARAFMRVKGANRLNRKSRKNRTEEQRPVRGQKHHTPERLEHKPRGDRAERN